jgi:hypothetical protein
MSERTTIPVPQTEYQTRIEVYLEGRLNREGCVQGDKTEVSLKLPAPIEECEIRIIPCNAQGKPVGRGFVYQDQSLRPEPPINTDPPVEPDEEPGEPDEDDCESSEIVCDDETSISIEEPEADEPVGGPICQKIEKSVFDNYSDEEDEED